MPRRTALLGAITLVLASCTGSGGDTTTTAPPLADDLITVATTDGSIVVYTSDGVEVANYEPPDGSVFRQPTWLDDATVVYSEASDTGDHSLIASDTSTGEGIWQASMESSPFFFAPAPGGSDFVTTSLRNNPQGGLLAELIDADGTVTFLGDESPFYTSWSPDGTLLAINNPGDHLDVWEDGEMWTILDPSGGYQTPVWLDLGLVVVRDVGDERYLSIWNLDEFDFENVARIEGSAAFVGSGHRIAIKTNGGTPDDEPGGIQAGLRVQDVPSITPGRLVTVDLETGAIDTVTTEPTAMFQWDPTGERLLYAEASLEVGLTWSIWDDGERTELAGYRPNPQWIGELIPFFDQYAQSVQFWSASGEFVAFPALIDFQPSVIIHDVAAGTETTIEDATWLSWATNR